MPGERELAEEAARESRNAREGLERLLALGLCSFYKWDRIFHDEERNGGPVDQMQHLRYAEGFTNRELDDYRRQASRAIDDYVRDQLRDLYPNSWWYGFFQGIASAFAYSLILVLIALIVKLIGSDLLTVARFIFGS